MTGLVLAAVVDVALVPLCIVAPLSVAESLIGEPTGRDPIAPLVNPNVYASPLRAHRSLSKRGGHEQLGVIFSQVRAQKL